MIPKTVKVERLAENLQIFDFTLTDEEYQQISDLNRNGRTHDPKFIGAPGWNNIPYFD